MPDSRFYVACDVSNLFKACRDEFGDKARVDFKKLSGMVPKLVGTDVHQDLVAYIVTNPEQQHKAFTKVLTTFGFRVRERFLRYEKAFLKPTRTDWDVGITIDAIDQIDEYDTFVLVSGDGDFSILLDYLKQRGKKTLVLTFENSTARSLYESADELIILDKNAIWA